MLDIPQSDFNVTQYVSKDDIGSLTCSFSESPRGHLEASNFTGEIAISCLWARLGPIKVVIMTTFARKNNFDGCVAKKLSFKRLFREKIQILMDSGHMHV